VNDTITRQRVLAALQSLQTVASDSFYPLQICQQMGLRRSKDRIHQITVLLYELARGGQVHVHSEPYGRFQTRITFSTPVQDPWYRLLWQELRARLFNLNAPMNYIVPHRRIRR
jgi:hypothetical protein